MRRQSFLWIFRTYSVTESCVIVGPVARKVSLQASKLVAEAGALTQRRLL